MQARFEERRKSAQREVVRQLLTLEGLSLADQQRARASVLSSIIHQEVKLALELAQALRITKRPAEALRAIEAGFPFPTRSAVPPEVVQEQLGHLDGELRGSLFGEWARLLTANDLFDQVLSEFRSRFGFTEAACEAWSSEAQAPAAGVDPTEADQVTHALLALAQFTSARDEQSDLLADYLGLRGYAFAPEHDLASYLDRALQHLPPMTASKLVWGYAFGFLREDGLRGAQGFLSEDLGRGVRILEAHLRLGPGQYEDQGRVLEQFRQRWPERQQDASDGWWLLLMIGLPTIGRPNDAILLALAVLGIESGQVTDPRAIRRQSAFFGGSSRDELIFQLALLLHKLDEQDAARVLLEAHLGLAQSDFANPRALQQALAAFADNRASDVYIKSVYLLATVLDEFAPERGRQLLDAFFDVDRSMYRDVASVRLIEHMQERLAQLPAPWSLPMWSVYARGLTTAGRGDLALAIGEAFFELSAEIYRTPGAVRERLLRRCGADSWALRVEYIEPVFAQVGSLLEMTGRREDANALAAELCEGQLPLGPETLGRVNIEFVTPLLIVCLNLFGTTDQSRTLALCDQVAEHLRAQTRQLGGPTADRARLLGKLAELRDAVITAEYHWVAREPNPDARDKLLSRAVAHDAELGQRLLFERLLRTRPVEVLTPAEAATRLTAEWPFPPGRKHPPFDERPGLAFGCFNRTVGEVTIPTRLLTGSTGEPNSVRDLLDHGGDDVQLAATLGPDDLLLRLGFEASGAATWFAVCNIGGRLRCVAHGFGDQNARGHVQRETTDHELKVALLWMSAANEHVRDAAIALSHTLAERTPHAESVLDHFDALVAAIAAAEGPNGITAERFRRFARVAFEADGVYPPEQRNMLREWVGELFVLESNDTRFDELRRKLNAATGKLVREISAAVPLDGLLPHLTPMTSVLVQAADRFHLVPFACLPIGGERLGWRVRSVRVVFSLGLERLFLAGEAQAARYATEGPLRVASVSGFDPNDRRPGAAEAGGAVAWLHERHRELARTSGC